MAMQSQQPLPAGEVWAQVQGQTPDTLNDSSKAPHCQTQKAAAPFFSEDQGTSSQSILGVGGNTVLPRHDCEKEEKNSNTGKTGKILPVTLQLRQHLD